MADRYSYVVVGAGRAGCSAVESIRELDTEGSILLLNGEPYLPYDRPPLSKKLWLGKKTLDDIVLHDAEWFRHTGIELSAGRVVDLDPGAHTIATSDGRVLRYGKLLLATGAVPRRLSIPGADRPEVMTYRTLDDFLVLRHDVQGKRVVVIGGGFIGSELAASLSVNGAAVTMILPERVLVERVFPASLGRALLREYEERGIRVLPGTLPRAIEARNGKLSVETSTGEHVPADHVVVGIGVDPSVALAANAGLDIENGVVVDELLRTSHPHILAAGDNAFFHYLALGTRMRIEHWDNAVQQGHAAGQNMAGVERPFTAMPYFFSDLFDFGYEAVGQVDSRLDIVTDWRDENHTGVIYYMQEGRVRGVMLCNIWNKLDTARELIVRAGRTGRDELHGAMA